MLFLAQFHHFSSIPFGFLNDYVLIITSCSCFYNREKRIIILDFEQLGWIGIIREEFMVL